MLFAAYCAVMLVVVGYANAFIIGWLRSARRYGTRKDTVPDAKVRHQTVRFWTIGEYWNVTVGADEDGLFLHVRNFGHGAYRLSTGKVVGVLANSAGARLVAAALRRATVEVGHR